MYPKFDLGYAVDGADAASGGQCELQLTFGGGDVEYSCPRTSIIHESQRSKLHTLPLELTLQYAQDDAKLALEIYQKHGRFPAMPALIDWECRALHELLPHGSRRYPAECAVRPAALGGNGAAARRVSETLASRWIAHPQQPQSTSQISVRDQGHSPAQWDPNSWYFTRAGRHRLSADPKAQVELSDLSTRSVCHRVLSGRGQSLLRPVKRFGGLRGSRLVDLDAGRADRPCRVGWAAAQHGNHCN